MVELSASMERRTITATITGMAEEYDAGRTFYWYLDGKLVKTERILASLTSLDYTYTAVPYRAEHTVTVQINSYDDAFDFGSYSDSVSDPMALWSWSSGNWSATAAQTQAAYTAISNQGRTADFNHLVWNDLVELFANARSGWNPLYATLDDTMMAGSGDQLTADRFNSLVLNIGNPWMFWAYRPSLTGYLGRLAVRGHAKHGSSADKVYGSYLIELARMLNVLIDAEGEFNAGYAKRMYHTSASAVYTSESLSMRAPMFRRLDYNGAMYAHLNYLDFSAQPSRNLGGYVGNVNLVANNPKLIAPLFRTSRHSGSVGPSQSYVKMIAPTMARLAYTIDEALNVYQNLPMLSLPFAKMHTTTTETLTTASEAALDLASSLQVQHAGDITLKTAFAASMETGLWEFLEFVGSIAATGVPRLSLADSVRIAIDHVLTHTGSHDLFPSPSMYLNIGDGLVSGQDVKLSPVPSERLNIGDTLNTAPNAALSPVPSERLTIEDGLGTVPDVELAPTPSKRMNMEDVLEIEPDVKLSAPASVRFVADDVLKYIGEHDISPDPSVRMNAEGTLNFESEIGLSAPGSKRLNADGTLKFTGEYDLDSSFSEYISIDHALTSGQDVELSPKPSERLSIDRALESDPDVDLAPVPSEHLSIEHGLETKPDAELDLIQSKRLIIENAMTTEPEVGLSVRDSVSLSFVSVPIAFTAALETYFEWVKRNGTNLHIRAAWVLRTDGDNLQIDTVNFYEPVQDGSNLYIQSVWFSYRDQTGVDIDMDGIFYRPVQDGSNLYIQSVYTLWLDDSEANVDADFFLDPIQTGSNLYIQMDVLGG